MSRKEIFNLLIIPQQLNEEFYGIQKKTNQNMKRMIKMANMKIVATTTLHEKEGDSNVGEHTYLTWHDENALITCTSEQSL
jgi:hypothetical protein